MIQLYSLPRIWPEAINLCQFCTKVEFWLKIHNIQFKHHMSFLNTLSSPTRLVPYIKDKNQKITDSTEIINYLSKKYNIIEEKLSSKDKQVINVVENLLFWIVKYLRHIEPESFNVITTDVFTQLPNGFKGVFTKKLKGKVLEECNQHGVGALSKTTAEKRGIKCLTILSTYLNKKKYFSGNEKPNLVDIVVFSGLVNICYAPFTENKLYQCFHDGTFPNLKKYVDKIASKYFTQEISKKY